MKNWTKSHPYVFLDEIQGVSGWEKWVRTIHELSKVKIVISGSNAKLLSKELSTLLTGRHLDLTVFPLSFKEFLLFNKFEVTDLLDFLSKEIELKRALCESLEFGNFPEVVLADEKKQVLLNYFEDIVQKDIVRRYKIRKVNELVSLSKFYLSNISSLVTFSSLEKILGITIDTIQKFSGYLESSYLVFFLKRFSYKVKDQEKSPRKVYAVDTELANTIGFRFSENAGRAAENFVFLVLQTFQWVTG